VIPRVPCVELAFIFCLWCEDTQKNGAIAGPVICSFKLDSLLDFELPPEPRQTDQADT